MDEKGSRKRSLEEILVRDFKVDSDEIYRIISDLYAFRSMEVNVEKLDKNQIKHTKDILSRFPEDFKNELLFKKILPYMVTYGQSNSLIVLAGNPTDKICERIPNETEFKKYESVFCPLKQLDPLIDIVSPRKNEFLDIIQDIDTGSEDYDDGELEGGIDESHLDEEINKSLLVNLYEGCLIEAVRKKASDIHIIPFEQNNVDFYFRIDGKLQHWHRQEKIAPEAMFAVVKDRSMGVDRFQRDTGQDGFAQRTVDGHLIRFRISILPIISQEYERRFESVVIRVIDDRNVITDLKTLGLQEQAEIDFTKAISSTKGIVIVTGPTGSGKSTTLMAALHQVMDPSKNVLTIEDPVEYMINGARQLKISNKMSFEEATRSIVRHDPDIVMVGEIRDKITADVAVKLANTGHLTFSTLHTNDAPSVISRLYKMGVEPFLLAYAVNIVLAQRLVRKLCDHCKKPLSKEKYALALELGLSKDDLDSGSIYEASEGCSKCNHGYKGRVNVCEALYFTPEIRRTIVEAGENINEDNLRKIAEDQGMLSLRESGIDRIRHGLTSITEVAFIAKEDD